MSKNAQSYNSKSITPCYTNSNTGKRQLTQTSNEVERITKNMFKDDFGRFSNQFSKNRKAEVFVEKSTGRTGIKEEIKYKSTMKFDDKLRGRSTEYETEVKLKKKVTFPSQSGSKSATLPKSSYSRDNSTTSKDYGTADTGGYDDESGYEEYYDDSDEMGTVDTDDDNESDYGEEGVAYTDDDCDEDVDHGYSEDDYDDDVDYGYSDDDYGYSDDE